MEDVPRRPINKQQDIAVNLKVSALMDGDGHWDHNILSHLFPENEMQRILKTQVGNAVDRELWAFSKNGAYTVKSGYELASKVKETMALQDASTQPEALELKRSIWKVPTVPKICNFLWRATSGALAVAERLNTRGMHLDSRCKLCLKDGESIEHVLFKCDVAQEAWAIAGFQPLSNFNSMSLVELMSAYLRMMSSDSIPERQRRSIPWILWAIWKNRNLILYADTQESLIFHIQQAIEEARLWNEVNLRQEPVDNLGLNGEKKRWEAPLFGVVKCNLHSNWRNDKLHCGVAYIIGDHQGNVLHHARGDAITSSPNRLTSELRCLIWTLRSMKDLGYTETMIGSDFKDVGEAIQELCLMFQSVVFETESILSNQIAREIARSVLRDGRFNSYLALGGPSWIHQRILREASSNCP
ncbi:hypothetical protein Bca52824_058047 [Brassica carinata]|uniref:Reverse transcriptase zinc-binding domain-containing protein n=1 Tax=Brassica carinata TaxID=52824 RepID=A0A8X7UE71_BRACI|nr:hypothetical protein Bca52824_058047 [Brassica carinata]